VTFDLTQRHLDLLRSSTVIWNEIEAGAPVVLYSRELLESASIPYSDIATRAGLSLGSPPTAAQIGEIESLIAELPEALLQLIERGVLEPGRHSYLNPLAGWREDLVPSQWRESGRKSTVEFVSTPRHATLLRRLSWRGLAVDAKRPYGDSSYFELEMAEVLGDVEPQDEDADVDGLLSAAQEKGLRQEHAETLPALQVFLREAVVAPGRYPRIGDPPSSPGTWDGEGYLEPYADCGSR
jgi:hypothetical protein